MISGVMPVVDIQMISEEPSSDATVAEISVK
jgi:hypothetical protein